MSKLFTVIIPCYKNSIFLTSCIDSVLKQSYPQIEIIVCEDCGGGFDVDYYQDYIANHKKTNIKQFCVYSNPENYGTVKNINCALKQSHGYFVKIIASDDALMTPDALVKVALEFEKTDAECLLSDVLLCDEQLHSVSKAKSAFLKNINKMSATECFKRLCVRNRINAVGVFFKKSFFDANGLFDEKYKLLEDWPTWLRIYDRGDRIYYYPFIATKRRMAVGVVSNNNPDFLADRRRVFFDIIKPNKEKIGMVIYIKSLIGAYVFTNQSFRKVYYRLKKGDAQ